MSFDQNMIFLTFEMQMDDEHLTESDTSSTTVTIAAVASVTLSKKMQV